MEVLESLRNRLEAAKVEERTTARKLRGETERKRKREQEDANFMRGQPRPQAMKYLLIFLAVAAGDGAMAAALLTRSRMRMPWLDWSADTKRDYLEKLAVSMSWEDLTGLIDPADPKNRVPYQEVRRILAEFETAHWVRILNTKRGVTPSSAVVANKFEEKCGLGHRPHQRPRRPPKHWAFHWRARWGARLGRLKVGGIDEVPVLQQKARKGRPHI